MEVKNFNPRGKHFHFRLNEYSCYKCKYEMCSLDGLSLKDIKEYELTTIRTLQESNKEYCIGIAKLFLQGEFKNPLAVSKNICGHYSLGDGQHRVCVVAHLMDKNADIELKAIIKEENIKCYYCGMMDKYNDMASKLTIVQSVFKTKLYREYKDGISNLKEYNILRKL